MADEVAKRLDSISMRGRLLSLKILIRDPSAPKEAPKVSQFSHSMALGKLRAPLVHGTWTLRIIQQANGADERARSGNE